MHHQLRTLSSLSTRITLLTKHYHLYPQESSINKEIRLTQQDIENNHCVKFDNTQETLSAHSTTRK